MNIVKVHFGLKAGLYLCYSFNEKAVLLQIVNFILFKRIITC